MDYFICYRIVRYLAQHHSGQRNEAPRSLGKRKNPPDTEADTDYRTDSESDSKKDSDSKNRARAEGEREREKAKALPDDIAEQMLQIWNAEVQTELTKGQSARITTKRRQQMLERWQQDFQQDIRAWRYFCEIIGNSDFCLGKVAGKDWTIDLGWPIRSSLICGATPLSFAAPVLLPASGLTSTTCPT
jgi:hypothetical protein